MWGACIQAERKFLISTREPDLDNANVGKFLAEAFSNRKVSAFLVERLIQMKIIAEKNPLIHCITNYVTVNDVANCILAVGASPIMADEIDEISEIISISNALVLNIGTANSRTAASMELAGKRANEKKIPVIFDPVGAGISSFRSKITEKFLQNIQFAAIRGNISEISFCAGKNSSAHGVDSGVDDEKFSAKEITKIVAEKFNCISIVTGKIDFISDGKNFAKIQNGVAEMKKITGTGCMLSGILAAHLAFSENKFSSAVNAVASMGIAGEISFEKYKNFGTGSLRTGIIDALGIIDEEIISQKGKITYEN